MPVDSSPRLEQAASAPINTPPVPAYQRVVLVLGAVLFRLFGGGVTQVATISVGGGEPSPAPVETPSIVVQPT